MSTTVLESLIDTTYDSVEGYKKASETASSPQLKAKFNECAGKRQELLNKLNAELQRHGGDLVTKGTFTGQLHRMWTDISDLFQSGDETALDRVEEGEAYLAKKFEEALEHTDLDPGTRSVIQAAHAEIAASARKADAAESAHD